MTCKLIDRAKIGIITGKDVDDVDVLWEELADMYLLSQLVLQFSTSITGAQYIDLENRNIYSTTYDGVRKLAINHSPLLTVTSVIYNPLSSAPETLTVGISYKVNIQENCIELLEDFDPEPIANALLVNYTYGTSTVPLEAKMFANLWVSFMIESEPAKNSDGQILKEITISKYKEVYGSASDLLKGKYKMLEVFEENLIRKYKQWS